MPSRIIREGIIDSELVNALSEEAELFYRRLMSIVDDAGRFEDKAVLIQTRAFPYRLEAWPVERIEKCLSLVSQPRAVDGKMLSLVSRYTVNGKKYFQINNFGQRVRAEKYPPPPVCQSDDGQMTVTCPPNAYSESEFNAKSNCEGERECVARALPPLPVEPINRDPSYDPEPGFLRFRTIARRLADHRWSADAEHAWVSVVFSPDVERAVFAGLERWQSSRDWGDGIFKGWAKWLRELDFEKTPGVKKSRGNETLERTRDSLREWAETDDCDGPSGLHAGVSDVREGT